MPLCDWEGNSKNEKWDTNETIASLTKTKRQGLPSWTEKGYRVKSAKINYIVAWKGKDETEETAVLLPEMVLANEKTLPLHP